MLHTKIKGLARLFRFELPFAAGVCVLLGELLAMGRLPSLFHVFTGFFSIFCLSATALILNDYFDIETDRINSPDRPLPSGMVTKSEVIILSIIVALAGFFFSMLISITALTVACVVWLIGFLYNWKFKKTGIWGNLLVCISVGMTFIYGGITVGYPFDKMVWYFAVLALFIDLGEEIAADSLDIEGDKKSGSSSLAVLLGPVKSMRIAAGIFCLVVIISTIPFFTGWLKPVFLLPIISMDVNIILSTLNLLKKNQPNRITDIKRIYLGGLGAMILFLVLRIVPGS
ncbi:MAG: UbiA family prenyltransferase [Fibrobacter sp.]|nr:UbiA family prenyltransferase [Fibrobacter sp.]